MWARGVLLLALAASACVTPAIERSWHEARTPNFVIWAALDGYESAEVARELEAYRSALALSTSLRLTAPPIPTNILVVPGRQPELGIEGDRGGSFREGLRANWAVARRGDPRDRVTLYHEYVHFLLRNHDETRYPAWFEEGFADMLAAIRIEDETIIQGGWNPLRIEWLRWVPWLPFREVILERDPWASGDETRTGIFYAQAWLLVHYLHWGRGDQSFGEDNLRFLAAVAEGTPTLQAFELAFEERIEGLDSRISAYFWGGLPTQRLQLDEPIAPVAVESRTLLRGEVARMLGEFSLDVDPVRARSYFEAALHEEPGDARAVSSLAVCDSREDLWSDAAARTEAALELAPDDPQVQLDAGIVAHTRAIRGEPTGRVRRIATARRHYERAIELAPDTPESLALYGSTWLVVGERAAQGIPKLEAAYRLLPGNPQIGLRLAWAYARTGRVQDALPMLVRLVQTAHEPNPEVLALLCSVQAAAGPTSDELVSTRCPGLAAPR